MAAAPPIWNLDPHDIHTESVRNTTLAAKKPPTSSFLSRFSLSSESAPKSTLNKPISKLEKKRFQSSTQIEHPVIISAHIDPNDKAYSRNPVHNPHNSFYSAGLLDEADERVIDNILQEPRRALSPIGSRPPPPYESDLPDSYHSLKEQKSDSKFQADTASTGLVPISSASSGTTTPIPIILLQPSPNPEPRYPDNPLMTDLRQTDLQQADPRPTATRLASVASVPALSPPVRPLLTSRSLSAPEAPLLPTHINRRAVRRNMPPTDPTMDRIDELDESNPLGPVHHHGPYEAISKNIVSKAKTKEEKRKLVHPVWNPYTVGLAAGEIPDETRVQEPIPVGMISLNLSPGEVLPHKILKTEHTLRLPRPPPSIKAERRERRGPLIMQAQTIAPPEVQPVEIPVLPPVRSQGYRNHAQPPRMAASRAQSQRAAFESGAVPPRHQQLQLQQQLQTQLQIAALTGQPPFVTLNQHTSRRVSPSTPPRRQNPQSGQELFLRTENRVYGDGSPTPSIYSLSDAYATDAFCDETQSSVGHHSESSRGSHQMWRGMESASQTSHSSSGWSHEPLSAVSDHGQRGRPWDNVLTARLEEHAQKLYTNPNHKDYADEDYSQENYAHEDYSQENYTPDNYPHQNYVHENHAPEHYPQESHPQDNYVPEHYPPENYTQELASNPSSQRQPTDNYIHRPQPNHLPKRLVMPTPLQGTVPPPSNRYQLPSVSQRDVFVPDPSRIARQDVPIHSHNDSNKLRKRASVAAVPQDYSKSKSQSRSVLFPTSLGSSSDLTSSSQIARANSERISSSSDSSKEKNKKPPKRVLSKRR